MRKLCKSLCKPLVQGHKCGLMVEVLQQQIQKNCNFKFFIRLQSGLWRETSNRSNVKLEAPHLDFITAHKGSMGPNDRLLDQTVFSRGVPLKGPKTTTTQMAAISNVV